MKRVIYQCLSKIPVAGIFIKRKYNIFSFMCSPQLEEAMKHEEFFVLAAWAEQHPNDVVTPKLARKIIEKRRKENE